MTKLRLISSGGFVGILSCLLMAHMLSGAASAQDKTASSVTYVGRQTFWKAEVKITNKSGGPIFIPTCNEASPGANDVCYLDIRVERKKGGAWRKVPASSRNCSLQGGKAFDNYLEIDPGQTSAATISFPTNDYPWLASAATASCSRTSSKECIEYRLVIDGWNSVASMRQMKGDSFAAATVDLITVVR